MNGFYRTITDHQWVISASLPLCIQKVSILTISISYAKFEVFFTLKSAVEFHSSELNDIFGGLMV